MTEKTPPKLPDRPLECGDCRKSIAVIYTEIVGETITHTSMCADCPELRRRLYGSQYKGAKLHEGQTDLACGNCGTTLEAVKSGSLLGCPVCYEVFDETILSEMQIAGKLGLRLINAKKSTPVHLGRAPGEIKEMNPAMRLLALNEALTETLQREDYEQAAWLRDQIKALTGEPPIEEAKKGNKE
ncbi:hypothetical protein PHSC3_000772 [Chlamydiales bacterium STE3]|nr:hypothetical protein PHSC3_000772 [Chlamydiales bacterium STE3]